MGILSLLATTEDSIDQNTVETGVCETCFQWSEGTCNNINYWQVGTKRKYFAIKGNVNRIKRTVPSD